MLQNTNWYIKNKLWFYTLTMNYQKWTIRNQENDPFIITSKKIKHLRINSTKSIKWYVQWKLEDIDKMNGRRHK